MSEHETPETDEDNFPVVVSFKAFTVITKSGEFDSLLHSIEEVCKQYCDTPDDYEIHAEVSA